MTLSAILITTDIYQHGEDEESTSSCALQRVTNSGSVKEDYAIEQGCSNEFENGGLKP